jgi:hypothetical protein
MSPCLGQAVRPVRGFGIGVGVDVAEVSDVDVCGVGVRASVTEVV